jgi:hypothetical protein
MKTLQAKEPSVGLGSSNNGYIEYIATFPNAKVNADDGYKACIMILNNLKLICDEGVNSPAPRAAEVVDISLESFATTTKIEEDEEDDE